MHIERLNHELIKINAEILLDRLALKMMDASILDLITLEIALKKEYKRRGYQ